MKLEHVKLEDIAVFQRGFDITVKEQEEGTIPVISSGGISSYHNESKVRGPGVVIGRKGTLGTVHYSEGDFWPHDTSLWIKDFKGNDPKFIYYFLKTLSLERFDAGASNPTLNRNHIHKLKIKLPEFRFRSKIASILSAYDELIENNTQRIALLEQMAEEIHKEWFVRLRFPGYEEVPVVDGLPEGWERNTFDNFLSFHRGKSYTSEELSDEEGLPLLNLKCISRGGGFRRDGIKFFTGKYPEKNAAYKGDIIMAVTDMTQNREIVGRVALVPDMGFEKFIFSMDLIRLEPKIISKLFLYSTLRFSGIAHELKEFANGANVLHLTPSVLDTQLVTIPSYEIRNQFDRLISPMIEEIDILQLKNENLKQTRDLLLPRLISGKLSVEHLVAESQNVPNP